jgi:hypothetical protein
MGTWHFPTKPTTNPNHFAALGIEAKEGLITLP